MAAAARFFGFNPPFIGGQQNVLSRQTDERLIKNDILQLLLTLPGERLFRPSFGSPLRTLVFDTITEADLALIKVQLERVIADFEERVTVEDILLELNDDGMVLHIKIVLRLNANPLVLFDLELTITQTGAIQLVK